MKNFKYAAQYNFIHVKETICGSIVTKFLWKNRLDY